MTERMMTKGASETVNKFVWNIVKPIFEDIAALIQNDEFNKNIHFGKNLLTIFLNLQNKVEIYIMLLKVNKYKENTYNF